MLIWAICMMLAMSAAGLAATDQYPPFITGALICLALSIIFLLLGRGKLTQMRPRQMFLVTLFNWTILVVTGAVPLYLGWPGISAVDALFESVSGATTTGSTVLVNLDLAPRSLLLWRSIMQWIGGIGIILMAVAVLPFLKSGGMRLFQTESSEWTDIQNNRVGRLSMLIGSTYFAITLIAASTYMVLGMPIFEAVNHAFTSVATGGYSTSDASFGQFEQPAIIWAGSLFMLLGAIPFMLYVKSIHQQKWLILQDVQVKLLLKLVNTAALSIVLVRWLSGSESTLFEMTTHAFFNVISVVTTTGYATQDYTLWGSFSLLLFMFLMFTGGCSGSTSGGIKLFRFQLMALLMKENLFRSIHPNSPFTRRYNQRPVSEGVMAASIAFLFMVTISLVVFTLLLALTGLDPVTAGSAALTALMNVGPGLGDVVGPSGNFSTLSDSAKLLLCLAMLLGRLEYLVLIILLTPQFWRW